MIHITHFFYDDLGRASMGERIRHFRTKHCITLDELAENTYISRDALISYENGQTEPTPEKLLSIAAALGVNPDKLCDPYFAFLIYPFEQRIKEIRKTKKLTQQKFAVLCGYPLETIKRWEQGVHRVTQEQWTRLVTLFPL